MSSQSKPRMGIFAQGDCRFAHSIARNGLLSFSRLCRRRARSREINQETHSMSLIAKLKARAQEGKPVKVGLIGAGKFGSMYLSQAPRTPGIHLVGVADLSPDRARAALKRVGWEEARHSARSWTEARASGSTFITDDADAMIASDHVDIVIDATGSPAAGIHHALLCCKHRKHIVMVNVE